MAIITSRFQAAAGPLRAALSVIIGLVVVLVAFAATALHPVGFTMRDHWIWVGGSRMGPATYTIAPRQGYNHWQFGPDNAIESRLVMR